MGQTTEFAVGSWIVRQTPRLNGESSVARYKIDDLNGINHTQRTIWYVLL